MSYRLFTTYFDSGSPERQAELEMCLALNTSAFDRVCVWSESPTFQDKFLGGMYALHRQERQKFSDLLTYASDSMPEGDIVVIANTDIVISQQSLDQIDLHLRSNQVYCLSRWEEASNKGIHLWDVEYGQDAWVFRGPPKPDIGGDYWFGVPGCDNRFAHELDAAGYEVLNPSRDIRTYHIHASNKRTATNCESNRVLLPYLFVKPHHLGETPEYRRPTTQKRRAGWPA
jgi:hypothetical protein